MATTDSKNQIDRDRENIDRLLTVFDDGGFKFGVEAEGRGKFRPKRHTAASERPKNIPPPAVVLPQRVKTIFIESWPEVKVKMDNTILPNSARSSSTIGGTPITIETAIALRKITLGTSHHSFSREFRKSSLLFHDLSGPWAYGLQTQRFGSRGLSLCIQGYLLKHLLFDREYVSSIITQNALQPNEYERRKALVEGMSEILWQAGEFRRCCVCLPQDSPYFGTDHMYRADGFTEKLELFEFKKLQDVQMFLKRNISSFEHENSSGCLLFLYSVVLSRTVQRIQEDMDIKVGDEKRDDKLLTDNEEGTFALVNLLLTGQAVRNLHNGNMVYSTSGKILPKPLRGVKQRSHVGFLFWDKAEVKDDRTEVGSMLKTPKCPIWLTQVNGQFGLLFSTNLDLVSDWRTEHRFVLHYFTGVPAQPPTKLNIVTQGVNTTPPAETDPTVLLSPRRNTRFGRRQHLRTTHLGLQRQEEKIPALEQCILTKYDVHGTILHGYITMHTNQRFHPNITPCGWTAVSQSNPHSN